jgi:ubiquinone/menaquinone biosynthesis C-methylase UbiE
VKKTVEDEAALYDSVVVPRYTSRFGQLLVDTVPRGVRAQVLDFGCGTGQPSFALLERLDPAGRVIAIDPDAGLVDLARQRAMGLAGSRIFFKVESAEKLSFGDEVFEYAIGNVVLHEIEHPDVALAEVRRVLAPDRSTARSRRSSTCFARSL